MTPQLRTRTTALATVALVLGLVAAQPGQAARQTRKVSGPSVVGSDVVPPFTLRPRISPDGEWIVWVQDAELNNAHAVWAVRRWGGERKRLSGVLPPGNEVHDVQFSPDSRYVVYTAEQETADRYDLYTVPLLGTAADGVKLTPGAVSAFNIRFAEDGTRFVFNTFDIGAGGHTLYSAPVDGSAPAVGLDGPFGGAGQTDGFRLAGDHVVFERRDAPGEPRELWSVPIAGSAAAKVRLTPDFGSGNGIISGFDLEVSPDGSRVAFVADDGGSRPELWSAEVAGAEGSAIKLVTLTAAGTSVDATSLEFTPNGSRIVFRGDLDVDEQEEVFSVPANGSASAVKLNRALIAAGDASDSSISPDGAFVLYAADWAVDERQELFFVPVEGPSAASERLNRTLGAGESVGGGLFLDDMVLYSVVSGGALRELRGAPYGGPASEEWPILVAETELRAPGAILGEYAVFAGDPFTPGEFDLFTSRNDGTSSPNGLDNPFWTSVVHGDSIAASRDESEIFFLASTGGGPLHLWATRVDGSQSFPTRLSLVPAGAGEVFDEARLEVSLDGHAILYQADSETAGRSELFISDSLIFAADFDEEGDVSEWQP